MIDLRLLVLVLLPVSATAGAWEEFEARCLDAMENLVPPLVEGMAARGSDSDAPVYPLGDGAELVIELAPQDGLSACRLNDPSGASEAPFDAWIAERLAAERYEEERADVWHSHLWTEPILEVEKRHDGVGITLRILETELDA